MRRFAPLLIIITGICWGSIGLFVRPMSAAGLSSMQISELRCIFAAIAYVLVTLMTDRDALRIRPRHIWCFVGTGILSIFFFNVCYYTTISMTSLSVAAVLLYTAPAFVLVMSWILFKEPITRMKGLAVVLTFAGCFFVSGVLSSAPSITALGVLIGIGSGFGYALYSIFSRFALERGCKPLTITTWTFIVAAIGGAFVGDVPGSAAVFAASPSLALPLVGLVIVSTVVPYILYTIALTYVENGRAAVIVSIEPVVATIMGIFAFGEALTWDNAVGIALVLAAIALLNLGGSKTGELEGERR